MDNQVRDRTGDAERGPVMMTHSVGDDCDPPHMVDYNALLEEAYLDAIEEVRKARVRFSREFAVAKSRTAVTDGQAMQAAIEKTEDELTTLQAKALLIELRLRR